MSDHLGVMSDDDRLISISIIANQKQRVGLRKRDLSDNNVERQNDNIVICRCGLCNLLHGKLERVESRLSSHQILHRLDCHLSSFNRRICPT